MADERNAPVSFKLKASVQKRLKALAVDRGVSMSDLIEWYCETLVEMYGANQLGTVSPRGHSLVLASLDDDVYTALRALAARERRPLWQLARVALEAAAGREPSAPPVEPSRAAPAIDALAWAAVVGAVSDALAEGADAVDAFYRAFPWDAVPADADDAAILSAALAQANTSLVVQTRLRRMYKQKSK